MKNNIIGWNVSEIIEMSDINYGTKYSLKFRYWVKEEFRFESTVDALDFILEDTNNNLFEEFKSLESQANAKSCNNI